MEGRPLEAVGGRETGSGASLFTALEEECWWQGPFSPPGEALCRSLWATERSRDSAAVSSATQEPCLAGTLPCCYSNEFRPAACPMSLPELVRKRLSSFSQTVFTDNNRTGPEDRGGDGIPDNKIVSNLPLQMSLYFNLCFFPFWWLSSVVVLQLKYSFLPDYYKFILVTVIILSTLIEIIRLYLGYMGNLQEKVPELAGFWLLSLLLQLPLILFLLLNEGLKIQPLERAIHIIFVIFLVFQVITAFLALKRMVNQLATRFHLHEFDRLDEQLPSDHLAWKQRRMDAPWVVRPPVEEIRSTSVGWGSAVRA
ncbi:transmembrane protein 17 isoform X1 [Hemicordylus capensis]|uniref:transmembrane protein 17 isoform X1 n=1 Tax=Hemicordylus capensis TaxID=884348 RepID=UPI002302C31F|nr:transmembrane protein 17 isoform X1 [Hemicordylus capensis]